MLGLGLGVNRGGFVPFPLLLDTYTGAAAAYSLRKLRTAYTGAAIRVRESATNTEADIGFNADGTLNTTALLAHVGANNGFVTTWYDQSGNARNATQSTAASQPQIVATGSVILENTKPAIQSDGVDDSLFAAFTASVTSLSAFSILSATMPQDSVVWQYNQASNIYVSIGIGDLASGSVYSSRYSIGGIRYNDGEDSNSSQKLLSHFASSGNINMHINGVAGDNAYESRGDITNTIGLRLFSREAGNRAATKSQEFIFYESNQSANRTAIESNINAFYNIYP